MNFEEQLREFERIVRQGFQTLTELHAETERQMQRMSNKVEYLAEVVADHETRLPPKQEPPR